MVYIYITTSWIRCGKIGSQFSILNEESFEDATYQSDFR